MLPRHRFRVAFVALACALVFPSYAVASTGLTSLQLAQLRRFSFAALPHDKPYGFYVRKVSTGSNTFTIYYYRSDGAWIQFSGSEGSHASHPAHHGPSVKGFMHGMTSFFSGIRHVTSTANPGTANEEEQEMSGITADSQAIGPIHFASHGDCLSGTADRSKAQSRYRHATFTVHACGLRHPDALIDAYRTVGAP
jgi:hypothetical protein